MNAEPPDFVLNSKWSRPTIELGALFLFPHANPALDKVQDLLESGADPNALHAYNDRIPISEAWKLNKAGCVWHARMPGMRRVSDQWTPLTRTAQDLNEKMIRLLIQWGAKFRSLNELDEWDLGLSPPDYGMVEYAIEAESWSILLLFLELLDPWDLYGDLCLYNALDYCVNYRRFEIAKTLLGRGASFSRSVPSEWPVGKPIRFPVIEWDPLCPSEIRAAAKWPDRPMLVAAMVEEGIDKCRMLAICGHDVIASDHLGITGLHVATGNLTTKMCEYFLDIGALVSLTDCFGVTPLLDAVYYGNIEAVWLLLAYGALSHPHFEHATIPLRTEESEIPSRPFNNELACMVRDGYSVLHIASRRGFGKIIEILVEFGADKGCRNPGGATPLDVAVQSNWWDLCFDLLEKGYPFTETADNISHMLDEASSQGRLESFEKLLNLTDRHSKHHNTFQSHPNGTFRLDTNSARYHLRKPPISRMPPTKQATSPRCCERCAAALLKCTPGLQVPLQYEHFNENRSCPMCDLLRDCHYLGMTVQAQTDISTSTVNRSLTFEVKRDFNTKTETLVVRSNGRAFHHPLRFVSDNWHKILSSLDRQTDVDTQSDATFAMAAQWIENCTSRHRDCQTTRVSPEMPTRLVDVSDGRVRLVQGFVDEPYVALSHRWGSEGLPCTTRTNLDSQIQDIPVSTLSRTLCDAIAIVRRLNFRYVWIDALCIIQDSHDDWHREASKMGDVFSNAAFTLAAADAENHSEGIFREHQAHCLRPFYTERLKKMAFRDRGWYEGEGELYVFPASPLVAQGARLKGPLDTRGWVLQEQLLSPRVLYYGHGELFWDCLTLSASESSPLTASLLTETNPEEAWAFKLLRKTISSPISNNDSLVPVSDDNLTSPVSASTLKQRVADVWKQVIKNYSARNLTKGSDKLIAISGIISATQHIISQECIAGMWHTDLWSQLLWWQQKPRCPREPNNELEPFVAPTWSWLNTDVPVFYHNSHHKKSDKSLETDEFTELRRVAHVEDAQSTQISDVRISGLLHLQGPCFDYRITATDLKNSVYKSWKHAILKLNTGCWLLDSEQTVPLNVRCVIMAEDEVDKVLVCMCLVPADEPAKWKRVGICHWDGLIHQVASYTGQEPDMESCIVV